MCWRIKIVHQESIGFANSFPRFSKPFLTTRVALHREQSSKLGNRFSPNPRFFLAVSHKAHYIATSIVLPRWNPAAAVRSRVSRFLAKQAKKRKTSSVWEGEWKSKSEEL